MTPDETGDPGHDPSLGPTAVHVDLSAITANLAAIVEAVSPAAVMPIVKANAYGHGLIPVAQHLQRLGVAQLGVAQLAEGIELLKAGVETKILVMGGLVTNQIPALIHHRLSFTASSVEVLHEIDRIAADLGKRAKVHLKIDTGMGRIGTPHGSASQLFEASLGIGNTEIEGVYSHFATADEADLSWPRNQLARFEEALEFFPAHGLATPTRHMSNSGGILQLPEANLDMVRPGIMIYGVYPSAETRRSMGLRPALSWTTKMVFSKVLEAGEPVSYGSTWRPEEATRILTIPVGYGDGYFRLLSNRGEVAINRRRYPIVGRVCMDQFMVDFGNDSDKVGDEVLLIGGSGPMAVAAEDIAGWAQTIPYEVLTNISARVPRVYTGA